MGARDLLEVACGFRKLRNVSGRVWKGCEQLLLDAISQNPEQQGIQSVRSADELPKAAQKESSRTELKCR